MFGVITFLFFPFFCHLLIEDSDQSSVLNGNVYLNALTGASFPCQTIQTPCKSLADFLNGNTSNYFDNYFYFAAGDYTHPLSSVVSMAPTQIIIFTGQEDGVNIFYNASTTTYGFVISMDGSVNYTRLNYVLGYYGTDIATRTLIRTNGGTCNADNCNFTMNTVSLKCSIFRNAYGGLIKITNCAFRDMVWSNSNEDWGCVFVGGLISGDFVLTNSVFSNLTTDRGTPVLPVYSAYDPNSFAVGNLTISGGLIDKITVGVGNPIIDISGNTLVRHSSSFQDVTFSNLVQDLESTVSGFVFSLNNSNLNLFSELTIAGNKFVNITGIGRGGVLYSSSDLSAVSISRNTFNSCRAGVKGGALFFESQSSINVIDNVFNNCEAGYGGAIFIEGDYNSGRVTLRQNRFYSNIASNSGADIYQNGTGMWQTTSFSSTCGNCQNNCFTTPTQNPAFDANFVLEYDQQCTGEVYVSGVASDNNNECIRSGLCGTLQFIISSGTAVTFIGVGNARIDVSGLNITTNRLILGDSRSDSHLIAVYDTDSVNAFSVNNNSILTLNSLRLLHKQGGEFIRVTRGDLNVVNCEGAKEDSTNLTQSFIHADSNTFVKIIGSVFSNLPFSSSNGSSSVIYLESGSLTLSSSTFINITSTGSGSCLYGRVQFSVNVVSVEDSCIFGNCTSSGRGGCICLNLTNGTSFALLSTVFFGNRASVSGGALDIYVSTLDEVANFRFNHDVHFYNNVIGINNITNNVHLETPPISHYCFTPLYNLRRYEFFDFTAWTFQKTADAIGNVYEELLACADRCGGRTPVNCSAIDQCWYDNSRCVPHPCLDEYSGQTSSPCNGLCMFNDESRKCSVDGCSRFTAAACVAEHADEGCGLVLGRCQKHNETLTPGPGNDMIRNALERLPDHGKVFLNVGTYDESTMIIGVKELWIGNDGTLGSIPVVRETSTTASMIIISVGGGLDINNLTLTSLGFNTNSNASLVYMTEGRLVMRFITVKDRRGTYCAVFCERPKEVLIQNVNFNNITHNTAKGGAGLGINLLGQNGYAQIINTTFTNVWVEGTAQNTRFGGAVWLEAHGTGHTAQVILCSFTNISTTDNAGALELYSDDNGGSVLCESTNFTECYTTRHGGAASCRGRPVIFRNCSFLRCKAGSIAGALYNGGTSDNYIEACTFTDCSGRGNASSAWACAVVYIETTGLVFMTDCIFNGNFLQKGNVSNINAQVLCVSVTMFSHAAISRCQFLNSYYETGSTGSARAGALLAGVAEYTNTNNLFMQGCTFRNNSGLPESQCRVGGALFSAVNVVLKNCSFIENTGDQAGAIGLENSSVAYFANVNFTNNVVVPGGVNVTRSAKDIYITSIFDPEKSKFEFLCFEGTDAVSLPPEITSLTLIPQCLTLSNTPAATPKTASTAEQFFAAFAQNVLETVTINIAQNFVVPPTNILSETITITSSNAVSPNMLTADESYNNVFTVSTGALSIKSVNFLIENIGEGYVNGDRSFLRLIGNGSASFDNTQFVFNSTRPPTANKQRRMLGQDLSPRTIRSTLIYFEFGSVTITKASFANFIFSRQGNVIYFNPSSRGQASLTVQDTSFTNISVRVNDTEYPRFGIAIFAWLEDSNNKLNLQNVSFKSINGSVAVVMPNLADLEYSVNFSEISFDTQDTANVYYGTSFNDLDNPEGNSLCNDTLLGLLTAGGIGAENIHLCLGGATSCTAGATRSIISYQQQCPEDNVSQGGGEEKKDKLDTGVIVTIIVVVCVVVVAIIVAVALVAVNKIKNDKEKYESLEKKSGKSKPESGTISNSSVVPVGSVPPPVYSLDNVQEKGNGNGAVSNVEEELEEEMEEEEV